MADKRSQYTRDSENGLDYPSPTEAFHDKDGMYKMRESEPGSVGSGGMVEMPIEADDGTQKKVYVPAPKYKAFRRVQSLGDGTVMSLEVEETVEEVKEIVAHASSTWEKDGITPMEWYAFTDPAFGNLIHVQREVLTKPLVIIEDYKDMEAIQEQFKQYEQAKILAKLQTAQPQLVAKGDSFFKRQARN